jgi:hypothetical protein
MARKQVKQAEGQGMESKFWIYIGCGVFVVTIAACTLLLGIDLGFVQVEGRAPVWLIPIIVIILLLVEWYYDIRLCREVRLYSEEDASVLDFIPLLNVFFISRKYALWIALGLLSMIGILVLIAVTPLSALLPLDVLSNGMQPLAAIGFISTALIFVFRGIEIMHIRNIVIKDYRSMETEGTGGSTASGASIALGFVPLLRVVSLSLDVQLITTTRLAVELENQLEGR